MKFLFGDGTINTLLFGAAACGAIGATGGAALGAGLLTLFASGGTLANCIAKGREGDFERELNAAQKHMEDALRLDARVNDDFTQDDVTLTFAELREVLPRLGLTQTDFVAWQLNPHIVAQEVALRLNNKVLSPYFVETESGRVLAERILFHAFTALKEKEGFWKNTEIYVAEAVLTGIQDILTAQRLAHESLKALHEKHEKSGANQAKMIAMLEQALSMKAGQAVTVSPEEAQDFAKNLETFLEGQDKRKAPAREAAEQGNFDDAIHHLMSVGRQDAAATDDMRRATAETFREAGELAYLLNTAQAIEAYENLIRYDGTQIWDYIRLSRLYRRGGKLASAKAVTEAGLNICPHERDRSVLWDEIGNIACDQGDLSAARQAFEDSLKIRKTLAQNDTSNAGFQRDLSVSYEKIGDVARDQGDLPAARQAFEDSLKIRKTLAQNDTSNAGFQRDLSVSYEKIGDVARDQGDLKAARKAFEDSLKIVKTLVQSDASNAGFQRDLSVSFDNLGDVARDQGDLKAARQAFEDSLKIRETLAQSDASNAGFQRDLAFSHGKLAELGGDHSKAHWTKAFEIMQSLKDTGRLPPRELPAYDYIKSMAEAD